MDLVYYNNPGYELWIYEIMVYGCHFFLALYIKV